MKTNICKEYKAKLKSTTKSCLTITYIKQNSYLTALTVFNKTQHQVLDECLPLQICTQ